MNLEVGYLPIALPIAFASVNPLTKKRLNDGDKSHHVFMSIAQQKIMMMN